MSDFTGRGCIRIDDAPSPFAFIQGRLPHGKISRIADWIFGLRGEGALEADAETLVAQYHVEEDDIHHRNLKREVNPWHT